MAQKPETVFRQRFDKRLKTLENSWFESLDQKSIVGSPDKVGCVNGRFVALEFKMSAKAKRGKMQEYKASQIIKSGGIHFWVYPENADEVYQTLLKMSQLSSKNL